ncbi:MULTISPECIES: hypothetical protein [unclassified Shewanella]|uniref:hypothetical protein n=1 Tax=unclassified Shewanella TaxID=196818 RepID=UPI0021D99B1B|nr:MULTISPECIES: hypothetical protein [unclassified Shewanella]MCU8035687.1 hypothetical protein [Shewanella sp. SM71]MCU8097565.1 hypothetical protein [Shewanella sp. SM102]
MTGNEVVPTSTVLQARVMLYQPSLRPKEMQGDWISTSFGRCRVNGRLGQRHADVVEAIMYTAERKREISDGGIVIQPKFVEFCLTITTVCLVYSRC